MGFNLADFPASASRLAPYVQKAPERNYDQGGHSFLGYSSGTDTSALLWLYQGDAIIAEYPVISKLRDLFVFCDDLAITTFFAQHQDLAVWLVRAWGILAKHFGADTNYLLKPSQRIPGDDSPRFVVYIQTHLLVADAMERLDAFDEEWLLDQIDFIGNKIIFNLAPL